MRELIDTSEMYLKTVYELHEEGVPALRARIVERLGQSGPTVSETVNRMERDGLVTLGADRQIHFTPEGKKAALQVMRRHRLVERLLHDVIKVDWADLHDEACRWEHVVSGDVADKIANLLDDPDTDPYGNPIPDSVGLNDSDDAVVTAVAGTGLVDAMEAAKAAKGEGPAAYQVVRLAESAQLHEDILAMLRDEGIVPGAQVEIEYVDAHSVAVKLGDSKVTLSDDVAHGIFVRKML